MSDVQAPVPQETPPQAETPKTVDALAQAVTPPKDGAKPKKMIEIPAAEVLANAGNKTVAVPTTVFKELKQQARQKGIEEGQTKALAEVSVIASKFGYDSATDFLKALKKGELNLSNTTKVEAAPAPATPSSTAGQGEATAVTPATPATPDTKKQETQDMAENNELVAKIEAKWAADVAELKGKVQSAEAASKAAQDALAAKDAEMRLRETFIRAGVRDADYLTTLMAREVNALPEDQLKTFDENAWLEKQKAERAYLFETAAPAKPATTGAVGGGAAAPTPNDVAGATRGAGAFNARDAKPDEYRARLAQLGLGAPGR